MVSFAVVGGGFRAAAYWRISARAGEPRCVGAVVRSPRPLPVPAFGSVAECLRVARPDFVVTAVPRTVTPGVVEELVGHGRPVLAETPPAGDLGAMRRLWAAVGRTGLVQVAEQYLLMPTHSARRSVVEAGLIGTPTQVQVSSTQLYHAVSLMRGFLGVGRGSVTVRASRHEADLVDPLDRGGWTDDPRPKRATTTIATLDFGGGRSGLYDFTDNQTRNQLRSRQLRIRGSHGELQDDQVLRLAGPRTIVRTVIGRDAIPGPGMRFNDDEIATARLLRATADWVRGAAPPPYPLVEGLHDHAVGLAIEEAAATGRTVTTPGFGGFGEGG
ncbi:gfo/Idh/MocA family oxidoreductase [Actinoplanes sp. NPDC051411]|uniref:Gfo/Idh/MocA family protein n=1 Tax=Actinoplanes sp. NPDC051411 TaxID=3155522 RepID=UPI00341EA3A7